MGVDLRTDPGPTDVVEEQLMKRRQARTSDAGPDHEVEMNQTSKEVSKLPKEDASNIGAVNDRMTLASTKEETSRREEVRTSASSGDDERGPAALSTGGGIRDYANSNPEPGHATTDKKLRDLRQRAGEESESVIIGSGMGMVQVAKEMAAEVAEALAQVRIRVMEKLAALQLPSDALEAVRKSLNDLVDLKDVYATTLEALQRTKSRLSDILPISLFPSHAREAQKVVEDMEKEVLKKAETVASADHEPAQERAHGGRQAKL